MKKIMLIIILLSLLTSYVSILPNTTDAICQTFSNQYGILEVCPLISTVDTDHIQFWNLTSNVTADVDIAFVFDKPLLGGGLYRWTGTSYVSINYTVVGFNGRTAYVFNNLHVNSGQKYMGKIEYQQKINTSGKWDMYVKLVSDTWANYRIHLDPWWDATYSQFVECFVDASYVGADLTNFPVCVRINSTLGSMCDGGNSIRFVNGDNVTLYPYEIEDWNLSGTSFVWVEIPVIDGEVDTEFLMYFNKSGVGNTSNPYGVWGANGYVLVNHFSGTSYQTCVDSSGNNNSIIGVLGSPTYGIEGKTGNCSYIDNSAEAFKIADNSMLDLENDHTIEFVVQPRVKWSDGANAFRIYWKSKLGVPYKGTVIQFDSDSMYCYNAITDGYYSKSISLGVPRDTWYYFADICKENSTASKIYENMSDVTSSGVFRSTYGNIYDLYIGADSSGGYSINAYLDEIRVSNVARSADWIKATYNTSFIVNMVYFGVQYTYVAPSVNPVRCFALSFVNNTVDFPYYLNNVSFNIYDDDVDTFNVSFALNSHDYVYLHDCMNGTQQFNFSSMLCALKNYTLWVNCSNTGNFYRYWFEFKTNNVSGDVNMSGYLYVASLTPEGIFGTLVIFILFAIGVFKKDSFMSILLFMTNVVALLGYAVANTFGDSSGLIVLFAFVNGAFAVYRAYLYNEEREQKKIKD